MTMLDATFSAVYQEVDGWIIAWVEEIPGAFAQERTIEEARDSLKEAVQLIIEAQRDIAARGIPQESVTREPLHVSF